MRGGGLGLFMALAVLGPRASAQPNAPLSRTPASPIVVAQDAAKAYWGRSVRDHDPRVPQKRELTHETVYNCSASGSECQNRIYWVGSYSTKWYAEDACNNDPTCVAYDWSETQSLGFMCSATTPRSDEYNEYVMCTKLPPPPPPMPPTPPPPLCPQGSGADEVGSGEVGPGPGDPPLDRAQICSLCEFAIYDNDAPGDWWSQKDYLNCDAMPNCVKALIRACADTDSSVSPLPSACEKAEQITALFGWVAPELNGFDFNQLAGCAPRPGGCASSSREALHATAALRAVQRTL